MTPAPSTPRPAPEAPGDMIRPGPMSMEEAAAFLAGETDGPRPAPERREEAPEPCPFCGEVPGVFDYSDEESRVICRNEDCLVQPETRADTEAEAIGRWNIRAPGSALAPSPGTREAARVLLAAWDQPGPSAVLGRSLDAATDAMKRWRDEGDATAADYAVGAFLRALAAAREGREGE